VPPPFGIRSGNANCSTRAHPKARQALRRRTGTQASACRDHLRRNAAAAAGYLTLKRRLAASHRGLTFESREDYSLAKTEFVEAVLREAAAAAGGGNGRSARPRRPSD
jgi:GrpB-like predicted nucleotidyltransferase (UPF0157 family)